MNTIRNYYLSLKNQLPLNTSKGKLIPKVFKTYFTNHGPIMAERDGKWISLKSKNRNMDGLVQSWVRTKAKGLMIIKKQWT
jgi:hypothetical protein